VSACVWHSAARHRRRATRLRRRQAVPEGGLNPTTSNMGMIVEAETSQSNLVLATCLAAALGAAFGNLAYISVLQNFGTERGWIQLAVVAPVMYLASRSFLDPLSSALRRGLGLAPLEAAVVQPTGRGLRALAAGAVVMVLWLADAIQTYAELHTLPVVLTIAVSILLVGGMTYGWTAGARSRWPLSALLGGLAGFVVNGIATYLILMAQNPGTGPADMLPASLASAASVGIVGFAGGLAIDVKLGGRPSVTAPLLALLAFAATGAIGIWYLGSTTVDGVVPNILLGLGWLLGLAGSPDADKVLRRA
jgi:hypothetical protein